MAMAEIILKGEIHSSKGDLDEERDLVKDGIDALVLEQENPEKKPVYKWYDGWFQFSVLLFFWFLETVYLSKETLEDLAEFQGADIYYTRETNADMLDKAPTWVKVVGATMFYLLLLVSLGIGVAAGSTISKWHIYGSFLLFLGVGVPPLIVRIYNMRQSTAERNRDQEMADIIVDAAQEGKVLAVVGGAHLSGITERLPEDLKAAEVRPVYGFCTYRSLKDVIPPLFKSMLVLFSFYLILVWVFSQLLMYYGMVKSIV